MAGDTSPSLDVGPPRAIVARLAEYDVLWVEEPLAGTDLRGLAALRASALGIRIAGGEMTRTFSRDARGARRGRVRRLPARRRPGRRDAPDADAGRAGPGPRPLVHAAHLDQRHRAAGQPPRRGRASAAGRSSSSRTTRRAGRRSGATPSSPSRSDPDADGVLRVPTAPGLGVDARRGRDRGGTPHDAPAAGRPPPTGSPERRAVRRATSCSSTARSCRRRPGGRSTTSPAATGRRDHAGRRGRRRGRRPRGRRRAARRSTTGAGPTRRRPSARRVLLRLAELDPGEPRRSWRCSSRSTSASRSATRCRSTCPSAAKTIQWYAETIDKVYGEVGPTGPDALVARDPRADRGGRRDRALELPADHHGLEAGRGAGDRQLGRPQAGSQSPLTRAAARGAGLRGRPAGRRAQRRARPGRGARRGAGAPPAASTRSRSPARPRSAKSLLRAIGESDVKAISLELGGKSPQLVLADVGDLEAAASAIGWGIFYNSGQTCNAGSRLIVHRSVREELVERIAAMGRGWRPASRWIRRHSSARSSTSASWTRCWVRPARPEEGARGRQRRRAGPRGERRLLRRADDPRRRRQRLATIDPSRVSGSSGSPGARPRPISAMRSTSSWRTDRCTTSRDPALQVWPLL